MVSVKRSTENTVNQFSLAVPLCSTFLKMSFDSLLIFVLRFFMAQKSRSLLMRTNKRFETIQRVEINCMKIESECIKDSCSFWVLLFGENYEQGFLLAVLFLNTRACYVSPVTVH